MADRAYLERLTRELADKGQLIEAGWVGLRLAAIPLDASPTQLEEMHKAYMAGAQHLWSSIMTMLDPGLEETEADMRKMSLIADELQAYADKLMVDLPTAGRA
jgi:hypothetical protein